MFIDDIVRELTQKVAFLEEAFEDIDPGDDEYDGLVEEVYEAENKLAEYLPDSEGNNYRKLVNMQSRLKALKKENDFYDQEAELDSMFPDRREKDFDEDAMSYSSVFGDD
jgi:hypothetical protein